LTRSPGGAPTIAKVKARARPWRSIFLLVLAVAMATPSRSARTVAASEYFSDTAYRALGHTGTEALADAAAVAFCLLAYLGTAGLAGRAREVLEPKIGTSHAAVICYTIVLVGGLATILITLQLFGIGVTQLLVGGAFGHHPGRHRGAAEPLQRVRRNGPAARPAGRRR
jgi:hypothetical protein